MKFSILQPYDRDRISVLSLEDKARYLDLLIKVSDKRRIPNSEFELDDDLSKFIEVGLIKVEVIKEKYWEHGQFFLNQSDFEKLNKKYTQEEIDIQVKAFDIWRSEKKSTRTNIYRTISNWLGKSTKYVLTEEQKDFIQKSYNSYCNNVVSDGNSKSRYGATMIKLFEKGYTMDELRKFLLITMNNELEGKDAKFRRRIHNVITEFEGWKKVAVFE